MNFFHPLSAIQVRQPQGCHSLGEEAGQFLLTHCSSLRLSGKQNYACLWCWLTATLEPSLIAKVSDLKCF